MKIQMQCKPLLVVVLSALMLCSALLVSCTDGGKEQGGNGFTTTPTTQTPQDGNDRLNVSDELPQTDMDGFEIRFLTREGFEEEITLNTEEASDVIDEAIYNRQLYIEDRFVCKITKIVEPADPNNFRNKIQTSVSGDDNAFHVAIGHIDYVASLAPNGYLSTWQTMPYVDLDKPWWNKTANDSLTVGGNTFFALGDINYWLILQTNCIYFNKKLIEDYQFEDPYQVVLDGRWTLDYLSTLTKSNYQDLNFNNVRDVDDFYIFTVDVHSGLNSYQNSTLNLMYKKDSEDIPEFSAATARMGTLVEKMYDILYDNEGTYAALDYSIQSEDQTLYWWDIAPHKYKNATTVFAHGYLGHATNVYRDTELEYGIIPLPKYDEKQKTYNTMMDASGPFMCLPRTVREEELVNIGIIIEGMAAYGYKYVTPAVFDTALKVKYSTLEGSGKMLDLLIEGLTFDFGYVHSSDYHNLLRKVLVEKNSNLASFLGKTHKSLETYYNKIIDAYLNYGLE